MIFTRREAEAKEGNCLKGNQVYMFKVTTFYYKKSSMLLFLKT